MSNLQLGLICVGIAIMVGVALYNSYVTRSREPRHAKKANEAKLPMDPGLTALLTEGNAATTPDTKEGCPLGFARSHLDGTRWS
jgi:hypothetical protein